MKVFFVKLLNLLLIAGILTGYQGYALKRQKKVSAYEQKKAEYNKAVNASQNKWADGDYEGSGMGNGGQIKVRVTITDHSIEHVENLSADKETPEYLESAKRILSDVAAEQSENVDMVTGATLSSSGILLGIHEALEKSHEANKK